MVVLISMTRLYSLFLSLSLWAKRRLKSVFIIRQYANLSQGVFFLYKSTTYGVYMPKTRHFLLFLPIFTPRPPLLAWRGFIACQWCCFVAYMLERYWVAAKRSQQPKNRV